MDYIIDKIIILPGLLIAITLHELAHGYIAYKLGDPTAKQKGRLSLNPLKHVDIVGFLCLLLFKFGWAKPVPINPMYFNNRKLGTILVSLAGPIMNFTLALLFGIVLSMDIIDNYILTYIINMTIFYNIILGVFNLLPFPPLDGSKIVASILPNKYEFMFYKYQKYLYLILITLVITGQISKILIPLVNFSFNTLIKFLNMFA